MLLPFKVEIAVPLSTKAAGGEGLFADYFEKYHKRNSITAVHAGVEGFGG